jgi:hypothetical protein
MSISTFIDFFSTQMAQIFRIFAGKFLSVFIF